MEFKLLDIFKELPSSVNDEERRYHINLKLSEKAQEIIAANELKQECVIYTDMKFYNKKGMPIEKLTLRRITPNEMNTVCAIHETYGINNSPFIHALESMEEQKKMMVYIIEFLFEIDLPKTSRESYNTENTENWNLEFLLLRQLALLLMQGYTDLATAYLMKIVKERDN